MRDYFDRLNLRNKLALGFGAVLAMMLVSGAIVFAGQIDSARSLEHFFAVDERIGKLSDSAETAMATARSYEKEFLLKQRVLGLDEAKARYLTLLQLELAKVRRYAAQMRSANSDPQVETAIRAVETGTKLYEGSFVRVVTLYARLGHVDTGLEGTLRARAHAAEILLAGLPPRLYAELLTIRRHEKDFILRGQQRYVTKAMTALLTFRADLNTTPIPAPRRHAIETELDGYRNAFERYVEVTGDIEQARYDYMDVANRITPELAMLGQQADDSAQRTRSALQDWSRLLGVIIVACGLAAMLLGGLLARFIVQNIKHSVDVAVEFAQRLAAADWKVRIPVPDGRTELATLARALNGMANELQEMHTLEQASSAELLRANRSLRLQSRCNELLVRATSETQLLNEICQRMTAEGAYRFVWVGLVTDECRQLLPAATAGNTGAAGAALYGLAAEALEQRRCAHALAEATHGTRACVSLPLCAGGEFMGAISIGSDADGTFDDDEMRLLGGISDDLAFGMAGHRERARRTAAEHALDYHTHHDALTGLANRELCANMLQRAIDHALRTSRCVGVLVLTLDRFKYVRSTLGHETGNALLRHAAGALGRVLREGDIFARFMGDEFAVILPNIADINIVERVAAKLLAAAALPCEIDGAEIVTTASIGASIYPMDNGSAHDLLVAADAAMACAQAMGGNRMRCYAPAMKEHGHSIFSLEADLRRAIEEGELRVHYQPRALLSDGGIAGAEALVRWQHPVRGMVSPVDFIPLAEMSGLIVPLGTWVLREVCRQLRAWLDAGLPPLVVAVNLSPRQFREPELVRDVRAALNEFGLPSSALGLEITESTVIDNIDDAVIKLNALKAIGIVLSLDDFGTGHSSLSRLRELPIDHLKIDQSFVRNLTTVPDDAAICRSIIDLAHNLRLTVIAEGVETAGQANLLRQHRCDEIQGYYFSRPVPAEEMMAMLARGSSVDLPELCEDQRRTLLIVDDEPNILGALQRMLRREGYRILAASSGAQALDILACHRVQVILSDQRMPGMCGADFLGRAFELYPDTIRMMLSGYTDLQTVTDSVNRGAIFKFIAKPWDDEQLRTDIRDAFLRAEAMALPLRG